jgi:hypothetical protein
MPGGAEVSLLGWQFEAKQSPAQTLIAGIPGVWLSGADIAIKPTDVARAAPRAIRRHLLDGLGVVVALCASIMSNTCAIQWMMTTGKFAIHLYVTDNLLKSQYFSKTITTFMCFDNLLEALL